MLRRFVRPYSHKFGKPPGALVVADEVAAVATTMRVTDYSEAGCKVRDNVSVDEAIAYKSSDTVTWIEVNGLGDTDIVGRLGSHYDIHPLTLEDILHVGARPKAELFDNYVFVTLRMMYFLDHGDDLRVDQVSLILGHNFVITFQERPGELFEPLRERITRGNGRIRRFGADFLAYSIIDLVTDYYFVTLERMGETIEDLEDQLLDYPEQGLVREVHRVKRELIYLRKATWPLREELGILLREEHNLIQPSTLPYLRDVYDHTIQVIDTIETFRDLITGILDVYLSSMSNRLNEVMKVLTIIATIFIPLTFITGIYGMNFRYMPELGYHWGYPLVWLAFVVIAVSMTLYFRLKKWL